MYWTVKHDGHFRTRLLLVFSTINLECSQMPRVFYHSLVHGLGFLICYIIKILLATSSEK